MPNNKSNSKGKKVFFSFFFFSPKGFSPLYPSHYFKFLSIKSKGSSTHIFTALSFCIQDPVCLFPLLHYFVCTTVIILLAQICVGVLAALQQSYMGTELRLNIYQKKPSGVRLSVQGGLFLQQSLLFLSSSSSLSPFLIYTPHTCEKWNTHLDILI